MVYVILRIRRVGHRVHPSRFRLDVTSSICNLATAAGHEQSCVALSIACEPQAEDCGSPKPRTSSLSSACRTHTHTHTQCGVYMYVYAYICSLHLVWLWFVLAPRVFRALIICLWHEPPQCLSCLPFCLFRLKLYNCMSFVFDYCLCCMSQGSRSWFFDALPPVIIRFPSLNLWAVGLGWVFIVYLWLWAPAKRFSANRLRLTYLWFLKYFNIFSKFLTNVSIWFIWIMFYFYIPIRTVKSIKV